MVRTFADALMPAEADVVCGASYGERSDARTNSRNDYRNGAWDTWAGMVETAIARLRTGSCFRIGCCSTAAEPSGLAAGRRCPPVACVITSGQRHDGVAFTVVLAGVRIRRRGRGPARTRPGRVQADKVYSKLQQGDPYHPASARHHRYLLRIVRPASAPGPVAADAVAAHPPSIPRSTRTATLSSAASTSSSTTARSRPATTSASTFTRAQSTSPRSRSGSGTRCSTRQVLSRIGGA
jgi:Transposase, Mutator family